MRAPPAAKELRSATRSPECLSFLPSWQKVIGFLAAEMNALSWLQKWLQLRLQKFHRWHRPRTRLPEQRHCLSVMFRSSSFTVEWILRMAIDDARRLRYFGSINLGLRVKKTLSACRNSEFNHFFKNIFDKLFETLRVLEFESLRVWNARVAISCRAVDDLPHYSEEFVPWRTNKRNLAAGLWKSRSPKIRLVK